MKTLKHTIRIFGFLLLSLFVPHAALAANEATNCETPTTKQVGALFTQWAEALKTKNPDVVTPLYATNGVLLPTLSNTPRTNHAEMRAYFVDFLKNSPVPTINQTFVTVGCNWASNTGIYTFKLTDPKDPKKTKNTKARFSYVYEKIGDKWLIINHHSSLMPEGDDKDDG
jgi:uncharacterized protein (TIGR02246 family)